MSNIKVEEYVRTTDGEIEKVVLIYDNRYMNEDGNMTHFDEIKAHSKNIVDLIEVGDIVNKEKVLRTYKDKHQQYIVLETRNIFKRDSKDIKTILTHELYEQNSYKVEE